jgi:hypothetical protein
MTVLQRIYIKSLCRIVRLFMDPNKTIDDTNIDRFAYYILCRRDPILSQSQVNKIPPSITTQDLFSFPASHLSIDWLFFQTTPSSINK